MRQVGETPLNGSAMPSRKRGDEIVYSTVKTVAPNRQGLRKLTGIIGKTNTVCIFINQLREKVGVMYGNPEVTTGGKALKYYSSVRIDIRKKESLKSKDGSFIGNHVKAKVVKNKVAPPFKEAEFDIIFGQGVDKAGEIVDMGAKLNIIQKGGAWYDYGDGVMHAQGRDNAIAFIKDHPELEAEIEKKIFELKEAITEKKVAADDVIGDEEDEKDDDIDVAE